jgi:predicted Zn-ribbon and HTH transcriptional regulator
LEESMETPATCPRCGSGDVLPIVYGMPGSEMTEESLVGKVALGGCVVFPGAPDRLCRNCGHDWRTDEASS